MDLEGRIDVTLIRTAGAVGEVRVRSVRPQVAQRLLAGRAPAEAADLVGTLFSLCGKAQRVACSSACGAANGDLAPGSDASQSVLAEIAVEHAWRLLLDWPRMIGVAGDGTRPLDPKVLAILRRASDRADHLAELLVGVLVDLLGEPPRVWLARDADALASWSASGNAPAAALLAAQRGNPGRSSVETPLIPALAGLPDQHLRLMAIQALADPAFCTRPRWRGGPAETGPLARCWGHPLVAGWIARHCAGAGAHLLARLVELASMPGWLAGEGPPMIRAAGLGDGDGLAAVETARGLLIHVVRLDRGWISEYRIIAPTEWNCADDGPLATALSALGPGDDLEHRARLMLTAIDPCVACALEILDA